MKFDQILAYHQATKHGVHEMAPGPRRMDWSNEPCPFRRYHGAPLIQLKRGPFHEGPLYDTVFQEGNVPTMPLNFESISQLFFDSLAISAWRRAGGLPWALRVNPSSGNLHPTEGYLICGPTEGLFETPVICHYAPREHALEIRSEFPLYVWKELIADLPDDVILVGLSSIPWRESWKYGERAFRYLHLNVGHALGALDMACAGLGWKVSILDGLGTKDVMTVLGLIDFGDVELEVPDCLLAIYPQGDRCSVWTLPQEPMAKFVDISWHGSPNRLSPKHVNWPLVQDAIKTTEKPRTNDFRQEFNPSDFKAELTSYQYPLICLRKVLRQRRSAIMMDRTASMEKYIFYRMMNRILPLKGQHPFGSLPWGAKVHLAVFVHRVLGLKAGLYLLVRDLGEMDELRLEMSEDFRWELLEKSPPGFYRLKGGDFRQLIKIASCNQNLASDGCFSLGMVAQFQDPLNKYGPWFYNRLLWECGMVGQALYLEAQVAEFSGCGIGCYFDDMVHSALGLEGTKYQCLYNFSVGRQVPLRKIETLPAYPAPSDV